MQTPEQVTIPVKQTIRILSKWRVKANRERPPVVVEYAGFDRIGLRCTLTNARWTDDRQLFLRDFEPVEEAP